MAGGPEDEGLLETLLSGGGPKTPGLATARIPNRLVNGRYELRALLGQGGMGTVHQAYDRELDEIVALKFLKAELHHAEHAIDRFVQEVKLARRVTHPNVARIYEFGVADEVPFLTMELIEGESLSAALRRTGRFEPARAASLVRSVCLGLSAAHEVGVVHRDIKPDNVLLSARGRVVITDFGIAHAAVAEGAARQTASPIGTPAYMAPEQVEIGPVTARTDLFALGVMLYELVTGTLPWRGEGALAMALARLRQPPTDPRTIDPTLPSALCELIASCLSVDPDRRPPSAAAVGAVLESLSTSSRGFAVQATRPTDPGALIAAPGVKVVSLLPLRNDGPDEDAKIALGLGEDLADALCRLRELRVRCPPVAWTSASEVASLPPLARSLGIDALLLGSLLRVGERFRVSLRLLTTAEGNQVWAERAECSPGELLGLQDKMAASIAHALADRTQVRSTRQAMDSRAVELYLEGLAAYHAFRSPEAVACYREALKAVPDDPMLTSALALALCRLSFMPGSSEDSIMLAESAAQRALELSPLSPEAHHAHTIVRLHSGDWGGAARSLRQVLSQAPGLPAANGLLGGLLLELGRTAEGMRRLELAARLEPRLSSVQWDLIRGYSFDGDWARAEALMERAFGADPRRWVARTRLISWKRDRVALELLYRELEQSRDSSVPEQAAAEAMLQLHFGRLRVRELLSAFAHLRPGRGGSVRGRIFAEQLTTELACVDGELDLAGASLERAAAEGLLDLAWMDRCPLLQPLRERPSFSAARATVVQRADLVLEALWS